jgi:hypothetical protein
MNTESDFQQRALVMAAELEAEIQKLTEEFNSKIKAAGEKARIRLITDVSITIEAND